MTSELRFIDYENTQVKLLANRKIPKIETPGIIIDDIDERKEFSAPFWLAKILIETGIVKIVENGLTPEEWTQAHFKERFSAAGPLTVMPKEFYKRAYVSLSLSIKDTKEDKGKIDLLNRLQARFREIIESRIAKLTRLALVDTAPQQGVLQPEEMVLWMELQHIITKWRKNIRNLGET